MGVILVDNVEVPIGSHRNKTIILASDHRGYNYKEEVKSFLTQKGFEFIDVGTNTYSRCDYPLISNKLGQEVSKDPHNRVGIGFCGSGIGILIPASKHRGAFTARCLSAMDAETSRVHNNSNILGIGADYIDFETALEVIDAWLSTEFYSSPGAQDAYLRRYVQTRKMDQNLS
jgi:ribose 5-phosphate isomerase B